MLKDMQYNFIYQHSNKSHIVVLPVVTVNICLYSTPGHEYKHTTIYIMHVILVMYAVITFPANVIYIESNSNMNSIVIILIITYYNYSLYIV